MGNLSKHFDKSEFRCQCGCGGENPSKKLIERLEQLFDLMGDTRDCESYLNQHWFGDERDGRNYIKTFQRGTVFPGEKKEEPAPKLRSKEELLAELKALYEKYI